MRSVTKDSSIKIMLGNDSFLIKLDTSTSNDFYVKQKQELYVLQKLRKQTWWFSLNFEFDKEKKDVKSPSVIFDQCGKRAPMFQQKNRDIVCDTTCSRQIDYRVFYISVACKLKCPWRSEIQQKKTSTKESLIDKRCTLSWINGHYRDLKFHLKPNIFQV